MKKRVKDDLFEYITNDAMIQRYISLFDSCKKYLCIEIYHDPNGIHEIIFMEVMRNLVEFYAWCMYVFLLNQFQKYIILVATPLSNFYRKRLVEYMKM